MTGMGRGLTVMGVFSFMCEGGCGHPLLAEDVTNEINEWMADGVAVTRDGSLVAGLYDGYGRLGGTDFADGDATVWHSACWETAGCPRDYRGESDPAEDQGWFFNDGDHDMPDPRLSRTAHQDSAGQAGRPPGTGRGYHEKDHGLLRAAGVPAEVVCGFEDGSLPAVHVRAVELALEGLRREDEDKALRTAVKRLAFMAVYGSDPARFAQEAGQFLAGSPERDENQEESDGDGAELRAEVTRLRAERDALAARLRDCKVTALKANAEARRLKNACATLNNNVEQILAGALGYPKYGDVDRDPPGNPGDYVTGDHTAESLAEQAAGELDALKARDREGTVPRQAWLRFSDGTGREGGSMTWPNPDDPGEVQWTLRYGRPSRADLLFAASVLDTYGHLLSLPPRVLARRARQVREAAGAAWRAGEAGSDG